MRRACHEGFSESACNAYDTVLERRASMLLSRLLQSAEDHDQHFHWYAASMVLGSVYGWRADDPAADSITEQINALTDEASHAIIPGRYLVEFFPSMLYFPAFLAKWKRDGLTTYRKATRMFEGFIDGVETKVVGSRSSLWVADVPEHLFLNSTKAIRHAVSQRPSCKSSNTRCSMSMRLHGSRGPCCAFCFSAGNLGVLMVSPCTSAAGSDTVRFLSGAVDVRS